jgi:hypothetical protein
VVESGGEEPAQIRFPDGLIATAPADSIVARLLVEAAEEAYVRAARGEPADDPWTVGFTAHLLWTTSPASRPHIAELVSAKFQAGIDMESTPPELYFFEITSVITPKKCWARWSRRGPSRGSNWTASSISYAPLPPTAAPIAQRSETTSST